MKPDVQTVGSPDTTDNIELTCDICSNKSKYFTQYAFENYDWVLCSLCDEELRLENESLKDV